MKCSKCKQSCVPIQLSAGIADDDGDFHYLSQCCKADVLDSNGDHITKKHFEEWVEYNFGPRRS